MKKVYICSPYRARNKETLERNIRYARELTRMALKAGLAPITPHLYMTKCLDERKQDERALGLAAGVALLKECDFVLVGNRYGISTGMRKEIKVAVDAGMEVVVADEIGEYIEREERKTMVAAWNYARRNVCQFCKQRRQKNCGYDCRDAYKKAYETARRYEEIL